jgi:hypothetical protein
MFSSFSSSSSCPSFYHAAFDPARNGSAVLAALVWHETGPLLLRVLARREVTSQLFPLIARQELATLPRSLGFDTMASPAVST